MRWLLGALLTLLTATLSLAVEPSQPTIAKTGDLTIESAWARATPAGAAVGAGYLRITNSGSSPDVLTGGSTPVAERIEIHEMTMTDGIMRMRALGDGLVIEPGKTVELKPGGIHLMLMGLKSPLEEGRRLSVTLNFKRAHAIEVEFSIAPIGAASGAGAH